MKSVGEVGCEYLATLHTARVCARYYYTLLVFEDVMASRLVTHEAAKRPQCFHLSLNSLFSHWNDIVKDIKYYKIITFVKYTNNYKAVFCRFLVIPLYVESLYVKEFFLSYSFISFWVKRVTRTPEMQGRNGLDQDFYIIFFLEFFYSVCTILIFQSRSTLGAESSVK